MLSGVSLGLVGSGRNIAPVTRPVGVDKSAWIVQQLIGVCTKVVPLCLNETENNSQNFVSNHLFKVSNQWTCFTSPLFNYEI